ncbi:uncharacterized membrane protein At1g16860-like [Juglans microcarpa x Juglans regia]|uniref:uncharacterized membrane protein At1g16860-like n=1 Tax=Juglans microcarpa x Juglans regia TaxID=2249226 RepID=UPI001B7D994C|nr:uncharacterized membrane protein At1g16860-like [Juglans microcarpa x Juglans regia]
MFVTLSHWVQQSRTVTEIVMNDLSSVAPRDQRCCSCNPIPPLFLYIVIPLFLLGLFVSIFMLIVVHNALFFASFLVLSALVLAFIVWNTHHWKTKRAILFFLRSLPESDLGVAREGQLVKITGIASCGSVALESSYEKVTRCVYASTLLYEYRGFDFTPVNLKRPCFRWSLSYCERTATDFYITDRKSGVRALVKAGSGCKVMPLVIESKLVNTTRRCRTLSPHLKKWLRDRNLSEEARLLRLEEGYVQEGSCMTVIGMLHRNNDILMIMQPAEIISSGCLHQKLLLPVDIDGLILQVPQMASLVTNQESVHQPDR